MSPGDVNLEVENEMVANGNGRNSGVQKDTHFWKACVSVPLIGAIVLNAFHNNVAIWFT